MTHSKKSEHLQKFIRKMECEGLSRVVIDTFSHYYRKVISGETGLVSEKDIRAVGPGEIENFENLAPFTFAGVKALKNAVIIVLNGGLGTSIGLTCAKSLLEIKDGKSFLEITAKQAQQKGVKLCFMNSFNTHDDTIAALERLKPAVTPLNFLQNKFPKILREDFTPASWPKNPSLEWNPPGHGDVYTALYTSGTLLQLLDEGIRYAFISNSDNLGATMDSALLGYFAQDQFPIMMEVAWRTPADVKGGHLTRYRDSRLMLREIAQCPKEDVDAFQDIHTHRFFNTNNIWVNLEILKGLIEREGRVRLPMILNPKTLDPRDETSPPVYQIEAAMGAAVSLFEGAAAVMVPRTRFSPVKTCNDLIGIKSDRYTLTEENELILNTDPQRAKLKVELDPKYYAKIDLFDLRFPEGPPSLKECESLKIEGDVRFERNVAIKGSVRIKNTQPAQAVIKEGTVIDGDLEL